MKKVGATLAITALTVAPLFAQDTVKSQTLLDKYFISGGELTWAIVVIGLLWIFGLIVFNGINLTKAKFYPDDLRAALFDHMVNCRVRSAIALAASHPSYLARMLAFSLPNVNATQPENLGREAVEDSMANFSINEARKQMYWINMMSLVAQIAPMMGLFGTVVGMVETFATLAAANKAEPAVLAKDIAVALLTTLWGLVVAMLAIGAYFYFKSRYNALVAACNEAAEELMNASVNTVNGDAQLAKIPEGLAL
jgi:biopolymer transport protein ExbB